jgi:hypothetical protein
MSSPTTFYEVRFVLSDSDLRSGTMNLIDFLVDMDAAIDGLTIFILQRRNTMLGHVVSSVTFDQHWLVK